MKILVLFAGVGAFSYLFGEEHEVTAVESVHEIAKLYKKLHPSHNVIEACAYEFLLKYFREYDIIFGSPPCQTHSKMVKASRHKVKSYPDFRLYEMIVFLDEHFKGKWLIENVIPYYKYLIPPNYEVGRHRLWSNFKVIADKVEKPNDFIRISNMEGKKELQKWLGLPFFEETIYIGKNHCPVQFLRNCVHPKIGKQILESALGVSDNLKTKQLSIF